MSVTTCRLQHQWGHCQTRLEYLLLSLLLGRSPSSGSPECSSTLFSQIHSPRVTPYFPYLFYKRLSIWFSVKFSVTLCMLYLCNCSALLNLGEPIILFMCKGIDHLHSIRAICTRIITHAMQSLQIIKPTCEIVLSQCRYLISNAMVNIICREAEIHSGAVEYSGIRRWHCKVHVPGNG